MIDHIIADQLNGARRLREWLNLETVSHMIEGTGADTGGVNALPHGQMTWTPGTINTPGRYAFTGAIRKPGQTWDDSYIYNSLTESPLPAIYFSWQMEIAFPAATLANRRLFETETEYCEGGTAFNMAWRINLSADSGPSWQMFNAKTKSWESFAGLPRPTPQADKFISARAHFLIDRVARICIHDSLEIDGVFHAVGARHAAVPKWPTTVNYFHQADQHDSDGHGTPLVVLLRNVHVRCL